MKKSRSIRLVLLGSASVALAACGDDGPPKDARLFSSVQECAAIYDTSTCLDAQKQAEQAYVAEGPKFARREDCEAEVGAGNCETRQTASSPSSTSSSPAAASSGGSFFMPMLMGYMLGNALSGGNRFNEPVYRGPNNTAMTSAGGKTYNIGSFAGAGRSTASSFRPATQVTQVQRSGFGGTATAYRSTSGS